MSSSPNMVIGVGVGIGYSPPPTTRGRLTVLERIGINNSTPTVALDVNGAGLFSGILYSTRNTATGLSSNSYNISKSIIGNLHIQNGAGPNPSDSYQAAITFQGGSSSESQAGIYITNNNSAGTSMGFATTDSYSIGPQLFLTASNNGVVNFPRANPTVQGNGILHAGNFSTYAVPLRIQSNWNDSTVLNNVVGLISWRNYGNSHVIFDASAGLSPSGTAVNNTNAQNVWVATYPTLMGWNGTNTYGVRVDTSRYADTAGSAPNGTNSNSFYNVTAGEGNGLKFWADDNYKISMGVSNVYLYGPVTDYSIKTQMNDGSPDRGFTWGRIGVVPVAAINATSGNMRIAGSFVAGSITNSATAGRIDASNDIVAYSTSDRRLKDNIINIENSINKLEKLNGIKFNWKKEHFDIHGYEGDDVGVIAQEIEEVLPEAIRVNETGYLSVRYEKIIPLLVEGIKELSNNNKQQQNQIDILNKNIEFLMSKK